jgi:plastocyanin
MSPIRVPRPGRAPFASFAVLGMLALGLAWLTRGAPLQAEDAGPHAGHDMNGHALSGGAMDERAMEQWVRDFYATHRANPSAIAVAGAPADTFLATGTRFDADANAATQVDNVRIFAGQSILWQWVDGAHTTTNGTGAADPNAGLLWDAPLTTTSRQLLRRFDAVGTFPFFCRPHEGFNMKGNVTVSAPADTFLASGTAFDTDANLTTQVDTAHIHVGQAILWRDISGAHTVTNGTGSGDPAAGTIFDVPLDSTTPAFTFVFRSAGTFPFFCRPHEGFNMRGVVQVTVPLAVDPRDVPGTIGFAAPPEPNPARGGVSFRFTLREAGPVRAEVFDAAGRRIAKVVRAPYPAGTFGANWDGRDAGGGRAPAGIYSLRLELPGFRGARRVAIVP